MPAWPTRLTSWISSLQSSSIAMRCSMFRAATPIGFVSPYRSRPTLLPSGAQRASAVCFGFAASRRTPNSFGIRPKPSFGRNFRA